MHNIVIRRDLKLKLSLHWVKQAFVMFREKPLQFLILEIITSALSLLPFLGAFLGPLLVARFMHCANKVENHESLQMGEMFKNLLSNRLVVRLAFLNFCLNAIILLAQYFIDSQFGTAVESIKPSLIVMLLSIPTLLLTLSMWLSPAICQFNEDVEPKSALWLSLKVCFYNMLVLLAFSVLISGISLVIVLPLFLLLLKIWDLFHSMFIIIPIGIICYVIIIVWLAMLNISTYCIYKSVYTRYL